MVEGKKNLPGEADIQKIKRYIERTHIPKRVLQYRNASVKDLRAIMYFLIYSFMLLLFQIHITIAAVQYIKKVIP